MYERAKYFKNKSIRNVIGGVILCALSISSFVTKGAVSIPGLIIIPVATLLWIYMAVWINKNLKNKSPEPDDEITSEQISYRYVEGIMYALFVVVLLLSIRQIDMVKYLAIPVVIGYAYWLFTQVRLLNQYFKGQRV